MAQLNDLLVMGQSTLLGPVTFNAGIRLNNKALSITSNEPIIFYNGSTTLYITPQLIAGENLAINNQQISKETLIGPGADGNNTSAIKITPGLVEILSPNNLQTTTLSVNAIRLPSIASNNINGYKHGNHGQVLMAGGANADGEPYNMFWATLKGYPATISGANNDVTHHTQSTFQYGTVDLIPGTSYLKTGTLYIVHD